MVGSRQSRVDLKHVLLGEMKQTEANDGREISMHNTSRWIVLFSVADTGNYIYLRFH